MNRRSFLFSLAVFALLGASPTRAADPANPPELQLHNLPIDAQEVLKSLKPRMTRTKIAQQFVPDGGLVSPASERYYLRDVSIPGAPGWVLMISITFQPKAMDDATYADDYWRADWYRHHEW